MYIILIYLILYMFIKLSKSSFIFTIETPNNRIISIPISMDEIVL